MSLAISRSASASGDGVTSPVVGLLFGGLVAVGAQALARTVEMLLSLESQG